MHRSPSRDKGGIHHKQIQDLSLPILSVGLSWFIGLNCSPHLSFSLSFLSFLVYLSHSGYRNLIKVTNLIVPMPCSKLNCHPPCSSNKTNKQPSPAHCSLRHRLHSVFPVTCCWKRTFSLSSLNLSFSISFTVPRSSSCCNSCTCWTLSPLLLLVLFCRLAFT
jgi:hypothetical protein